MSELRGWLSSRGRLLATATALGALYATAISGCGESATVRHPAVGQRADAFAAGTYPAQHEAGQTCAAGRVTLQQSVHVGRGVGPLAVGNGVLWAAREQAGTITRVTASERRVLRVGSTPVSLALGLGKLWAALRDADEVAYVDTRTLSVKRIGGVPVPVSVIAGRERAWVLSLDSQALYQLSPEGWILGEPIYAPVGDPIDMVAAADEVWMLGAREGGLSPVNARLKRVVRAGFDLPGRVLSGLSAAGHTIWVAEPTRRALLRLDATSTTVTELSMPNGIQPWLTAVGKCGVWVASRIGALELVDPQTGMALAPPIRVGRSIAALVASGVGVWISDSLDGTVTYVTARPLAR